MSLPQAPELDAQPLTAQTAAAAGPTAEQLAVEAGWTMAVLYGKIEPIPRGQFPGLPTANELQPADRRKLESDRLGHLLRLLAAMPGFAGSSLPTEVPAPDGNEEAWEQALRRLNLDILCALAATRQQTQLAYELGRSLRDTANPPDQHPPTLAQSRVFARDRIAALQGWLAELTSQFPPQTAAVVATSLGRWSDFATITAGTMAMRRVMRRRSQGRIRILRNPSMTIWPASVPVSVEFCPDASSARAKTALAPTTPSNGVSSL